MTIIIFIAAIIGGCVLLRGWAVWWPNKAQARKSINKAVIYGNLADVELHLQNGVDVNARDADGETALMRAAIFGKLDVSIFLVDKGADVNAKGKRSSTPLMQAAGHGYLDIVKFLVSKGAEVNVRNDDDETPLWRAIASSPSGIIHSLNLDTAVFLVDQGADVNEVHKKSSLLLKAVVEGHPDNVRYYCDWSRQLPGIPNYSERAVRRYWLDAVKFLVSKGADVNVRDKNGCTPLSWAGSKDAEMLQILNDGKSQSNCITNESKETPMKNYKTIHEAAQNGDISDVELHVQKGADVNAMDKDGGWFCGWTPLMEASYNGHLEVVKYLVGKGADVNAGTKGSWVMHGMPPLSGSARFGHLEVVKHLVDKGADVNAGNKLGATPLMWATCHLDVVKYLVDKGADVNAKDEHGSTALMLATDGHLDVVQFLLDKGAELDARDKDGWTPLIWAACMSPHLDVVKFLVAKGADMDLKAKDKDGMTPLMRAMGTNDRNILEFLKQHGAKW